MKRNGLFLSVLVTLVLIFGVTGCPGPDTSTETVDKCTLEYSANGGSGTVPASQTVKQGTTLIVADKGDLSYPGKIFSGWKTSSAGNYGTAYAPGDPIEMKYTLTLYAQWSDIVYTVSYNANGATGTVPSERTVKEGETITVSSQGSLSYTGKAFGGWNTEADGSGTSYASGASLTVSENVTLYAQWVDQYTLSYHANGGDGTVPGSRTVTVGTAVTVSGRASLTYTWKNFNGWNTETDGSGTPYAANDSLTVNENITLYAQWTAIRYTVTYHANGGTGTVPESQSVDGGDSITLASGDELTKVGYPFGGWNTTSSGTGTNYQAGSSFTVTANTTLYARWIAPRIRTEDAYKDVTNGTIRIHLETSEYYIFSGTDEYRLYRSTTRYGTYSLVATVSADQLVLEDTTADWMVVSGSYFYKVAAVLDGNESMSINGVRIDYADPKVYQCQPTSGYSGVRLQEGIFYTEWAPEYSSANVTYELRKQPPLFPGNYILFTSTSIGTPVSWINRGALAIRFGHTYTINPISGTTEGSFVKSNWTFFTP
jgi:hypothetical protein